MDVNANTLMDFVKSEKRVSIGAVHGIKLSWHLFHLRATIACLVYVGLNL